jgi:hypothetical protein
MLRKITVLMALALCAGLLMAPTVFAADTVKFEPVRAPAKGPDNAPVTIIEIADFM